MSEESNESKMLELLKKKPEGILQSDIVSTLGISRQAVNDIYKKIKKKTLKKRIKLTI